MVVQALVKPGDIVIVDRNCHKSHHYGLVLGGGQPLYVEAFPLTEYSMYGAVPLATIKKALSTAEGDALTVSDVDLKPSAVTGTQIPALVEECSPPGFRLPVGGGSGLPTGRPLRPRTAMYAAAALEEWLGSRFGGGL
jgi:arginine decarboxylase